MRVDTRPRHKNRGRPAEKSAPQFLQWLRGRPCAACGGTLCLEAAHVDHAGGKGTGTKVADRHAIPLCNVCHAVQHNGGWKTFERDHLSRQDAVMMAEAYWKAWPGRIAWQAKNG